MIGIIARYEQRVVYAVGHSEQQATEIVVRLLAEAGIDVQGLQMEVIVFDPHRPGGMLISLEDEDQGQWTPEGWSPSE